MVRACRYSPVADDGARLGVGLIVFMALLTLYTCQLVVRTGEGGTIDGKPVEFPDVCRIYLGRSAYYVAVVFSLLTFLGACLVYWVLMTDFLYSLVLFMARHPEETGADGLALATAERWRSLATGWLTAAAEHGVPTCLDHVRRNETLSMLEQVWNPCSAPVFLVALLFPLLNAEKLTFFTKFNALGVISIAYNLLFVFVKAGQWGVHYDHGLPEARGTMFSLTGVLTLSFFMHNGCLSILRNNRQPSNNARDLSIAYSLVAATYAVIGA